MTFLVSMDNPRMLQALADYLAVQGMACTIKPTQSGGELHLLDPTHYDQAMSEVQQFMAEPNNPKYLQASWDRNDTQVAWFNYGNGHVIRTRFLAHAGWFTLSLFIVCWLIFVLQPFYGYNAYWFPSDFPQISGTDWFRVISPALIHFSLIHIVFNSIWWWYLGGMIERKMSTMTLISLFLITAITANIVQFYHSGNSFGGLSGVVYGLTGFVWLTGLITPQRGIALPNSIFVFMLFWMLLGMLDMLMVQVANSAHFIGLISGLIIALVFAVGEKKPT